jgi:hypothetical protein
VRQVRGIIGPEVPAVEDAMVLDVVSAHVPQKGQSPVHRNPVHPVLEEIRIENTGDEPHRESRGGSEPKLIESKREESRESDRCRAHRAQYGTVSTNHVVPPAAAPKRLVDPMIRDSKWKRNS